MAKQRALFRLLLLVSIDHDPQTAVTDRMGSIWDLFRATFPFLTVTDPEALSEMIRALLDIFQHEGWMPDCRMTFAHGYTQGDHWFGDLRRTTIND